MGLFEKAYNGFADFGNAINHGVNSVAGKKVVGDIQKIEAPKEYPPYNSFSKYEEIEPAQWIQKKGTDKTFAIGEESVFVVANLDTCMIYKNDFLEAADYYTRKFKFMYENCVQDFDSFTNYFTDMYVEGLRPMLDRAYSLFLPFGIFDTNIDAFIDYHTSVYNRAYKSYQAIVGIEEQHNQQAENLGENVGGSIRMSGGGFGMKGAMKGMAKAEAFNLGMGLLGKYVANQTKMTLEQKAEVFSKFNVELFFEEVRSDYRNVFYSMIQLLSDKGLIGNTTTKITEQDKTIANNLNNPMFPNEQFMQVCVGLISRNPFMPTYYDILANKIGNTDELMTIKEYFKY